MKVDSHDHLRSVVCGYFPAPFPDETLFSTAARFNRLIGTRSARAAGTILTNSERAVRSASCLPNLTLLASVIPPHFPGGPESILYNHTLGGLYLRFMKNDGRILAMDSAVGPRRPRRSHAFRWMTKIFEQLHPMRYCRECVAHDLAAHGCSYWHLQHQAPLVHCCSLHQTALVEVKRPPYEWLLPSPSLVGSQYHITEFEMQYAAVMPLLFGQWHYDIFEGRRNVARLLEDARVVPTARSVETEEVRKFLKQHVPATVLSRAVAVTRTRAEDWLGPFLKGDGNQHPIWLGIMLTCLARAGIPKHLIAEVAQGPRQREIPGLRPVTIPPPFLACEALEQGVSQIECAQRFGVSTNVVQRWFRDESLHRR